MINQQIYIINGRPHIRVVQQPAYAGRQFMSRPVYVQPLPAQQPQPLPSHINAFEGITIVEEYEPQAGDPIVVEQAIYNGEVVIMGNRSQQVMNESETLLCSQGFVSEDGKIWKQLPKIMMTVFTIGQLQIKNVTKVKAKFDSHLPHHKIMKISCGEVNYYLGFKPNQFNQWFLRLVWSKLMIEKRECQQFGVWQRSISGRVFKKSQFFGEWQARTVSISHAQGLLSSKQSGGPATMQIKDTKQIWTRFEQIKGGYFLVIKLWYGIMKTEFAVPTVQCISWLYHFLALLSNQ